MYYTANISISPNAPKCLLYLFKFFNLNLILIFICSWTGWPGAQHHKNFSCSEFIYEFNVIPTKMYGNLDPHRPRFKEFMSTKLTKRTNNNLLHRTTAGESLNKQPLPNNNENQYHKTWLVENLISDSSFYFKCQVFN